MTSIDTVEQRLADVKSTIAKTSQDSGRHEGAVNLVAVSKTHGPDAITAVLKAGQKIFGENRVQEAEAKWPDLKQCHPEAQLHLIGPLQRNKAALAVSLFDVIETIDRLKLATALARHMDEVGRRPNCFIQVNTGEELQKAGVLPKDADSFIAQCQGELNLPIIGLMCIPPVDEEAALHFGLLREIAERNGLAELSMGMSADFETAIQFGATYVRVGTAIFGPRSDYWQNQS
jgi:PLP dependent protein